VAETVRRQFCTPSQLTDEPRHGPRKGSAHLRRAIEEISAGAWSAPEARAATLLRRAGVAPFEQNAPILLPNGRQFIADFLWRALRAVLEIDSYAHHGLPADADGTSARHLFLETLDFSVVTAARGSSSTIRSVSSVRSTRGWPPAQRT
jgi:very-short-patch-repair endonuclease